MFPTSFHNKKMHSFKIKSLSEFPERSHEVLDIINQEFNYPKEQSFDIDFYGLFNKDNYQHCHCVLINNEIIGHIGIKLRKFGIKDIRTPVALVGGIAIKKKFQGKGFFTEAFQIILNKYSREVSFFLLWSDLTSLYNKFDFYECGETVQSYSKSFHAKEFKDYQKTKFKFLSDIKREQLKKIYYQDFELQILGMKRELQDWNDISMVDSVDLYIKESNDEIISYFFTGKGKDLAGVIHEASSLAVNELKNFKMWLNANYSSNFPNGEIIFTSFVKLSDLNRLNAFLSELTSDQMKISEMNEKQITFNFVSNKFKVTPEEFLKLLLGPGQPIEMNKIIPPYFVTGLDSV